MRGNGKVVGGENGVDEGEEGVSEVEGVGGTGSSKEAPLLLYNGEHMSAHELSTDPCHRKLPVLVFCHPAAPSPPFVYRPYPRVSLCCPLLPAVQSGPTKHPARIWKWREISFWLVVYLREILLFEPGVLKLV